MSENGPMSLTSANSRLVLEASVLSGCKNEFLSNEEHKQANIIKYWWTLGIVGKKAGAFFATLSEGSGLESYGAVGHVKVSFEKWWALGIVSHVPRMGLRLSIGLPNLLSLTP